MGVHGILEGCDVGVGAEAIAMGGYRLGVGLHLPLGVLECHDFQLGLLFDGCLSYSYESPLVSCLAAL